MRNKNQQDVVMIADDDLFICELVKKTLPNSCKFIEIEDGADLTDRYKEEIPDILFLDIHLPSISGTELIQKIKEIDKDAYIIMLTADCTTKNVKDANDKGSNGFIGKPFTKKTLLTNFSRCPTIKYK